MATRAEFSGATGWRDALRAACLCPLDWKREIRREAAGNLAIAGSDTGGRNDRRTGEDAGFTRRQSANQFQCAVPFDDRLRPSKGINVRFPNRISAVTTHRPSRADSAHEFGCDTVRFSISALALKFLSLDHKPADLLSIHRLLPFRNVSFHPPVLTTNLPAVLNNVLISGSPNDRKQR